ncbi:MAG TPA: hypothetical protein VGN88_06755 [Phycisphaerae bacterium]|jgi:hypothetical protein
MSDTTLLMLGRDRSVSTTLVRALTGQKALYQQILTLAHLQSGHVAAGETEPLMTVLGARSRLIEQVTPLDRELQPYKGRWQEVLDGLPAAERKVVGGLLQDVQKLLSDILAQDEHDKESLIRQRAVVGSEIKRTVTGAALNRAYGVGARF